MSSVAQSVLVTGLQAGQPGLDSRQVREIFFLASASRPVLGPVQSSIQWVPGVLSPGIKWLGRNAGHSPPSCAEVKKDYDTVS
jgi:hypothetical protein